MNELNQMSIEEYRSMLDDFNYIEAFLNDLASINIKLSNAKPILSAYCFAEDPPKDGSDQNEGSEPGSQPDSNNEDEEINWTDLKQVAEYIEKMDPKEAKKRAKRARKKAKKAARVAKKNSRKM